MYLHNTYCVVIYLQMKNNQNILEGYSAAQAADFLGVQAPEITRLYRNGDLSGRKVPGGALLLDASSVQAYKTIFRGSGRPWDSQTAWAALLLVGGEDVSWINYHKLRRLKLRIPSLSAEDLVWLSRKRSNTRRYRVSSSFSEDLKASLVLSGMSTSAAADMGLVASSSTIDGYAKNLEQLEKDLFLMPDVSGNCIIRVAVAAPDEIFSATQVPTVIVAADLAMSVDTRERRCGLDYLEGALDAIRRS